ncbi:hypothetical protein IVW58_21900 [Salmonella enterica subsp. enterica serovar Worthington]|nr:hypothetical protein [Salmonella enterica subsp. enterica serovar Worthington]
MKRTPVLVDVHGTPLRESLGYTGGGSVSADRWLTGCPGGKRGCRAAAFVAPRQCAG